MAARLHPAPEPVCEIVDLRRLSARSLDALLHEECLIWRSELEWDFDKPADLVRRFVDMGALSGSALIENGEVVGYVYFVLEEDKGLIGDLYIRRHARTTERENLLLSSALNAAMDSPQVRRIESQLMMLAHDPRRRLPCQDCLSVFERNFMRIDLHTAALRKSTVRRPIYTEKWNDHYQDAAASLIAAAYNGHIDSRINDQYRSAIGARRFLHNIVQYPGCGAFYRPASMVAFEGVNGRLCGISLASLVTPETGHVTQICVSPEVRGMGVGHELLRQSLTNLRDMGCSSASLTVTAANEDAVALYKSMGFQIIRRFAAYVWSGFQGPH
jgi:ribosomal protein S18 acetylase RimI-like enzyme